MGPPRLGTSYRRRPACRPPVLGCRTMTKKARQVFTCTECGHSEAKWLGKCPGCGGWSTLVEETVAPPASAARARRTPGVGGRPVPLREVGTDDAPRRPTGIAELDRVLGGGVVPGSLVLIGGDPGIGKSTLMLMAAARLCGLGPVLYVSGEESLAQIRLRAGRLGIDAEALHLLAETDGDRVLAEAGKMKPAALVIDSIQTLHVPEVGSAPGSVVQVRELTGLLLGFAKRTGTPTFLVGHVTKEGSIAGPRVLEHMVDTVLYFEGDRSHAYRVLRAHKNRFGSVAGDRRVRDAEGGPGRGPGPLGDLPRRAAREGLGVGGGGVGERVAAGAGGDPGAGDPGGQRRLGQADGHRRRGDAPVAAGGGAREAPGADVLRPGHLRERRRGPRPRGAGGRSPGGGGGALQPAEPPRWTPASWSSARWASPGRCGR